MKRQFAVLALAAGMTIAMGMTALAEGWRQESDGRWWYAANDTGTERYTNGWYWIDGNHDAVAECYYFGSDGYMWANTRTPDNYLVNADGAWIDESGQVYIKANGPGGVVTTRPAGAQSSEDQAAGPGTSAEEAEAETPAGVLTSSGRYIDPTRPMVALTYDDGPQTTAGNHILDVLAQYGAKATFFVVGDRCASRASEMQRMVAEGHEVGNHTYNHKYLNTLGAAEIQAQVNRGTQAILDSSGAYPNLVRLPGGNRNATVLANVNFPMIMWSIDTLDWKTRNAQNTISSVLNNVKDGDIVLMHELYDATATATETIVPELVARGYQLVTVSEMAEARGVQMQPGQLYFSFRP